MALLRRCASLRTRNFLTFLTFTPNTKPNLTIRFPAVSTCSRPRLYCSGLDSPNQNNLKPNDDVSTADLKKLIERYAKGGEDNVIPLIFEAVLKRSLSGNHEESDDELLEELERNRPPEQVSQGEDNWEDDELPEMYEEILERTLAHHISTMPSQPMDNIKDGNLESGKESSSEDDDIDEEYLDHMKDGESDNLKLGHESSSEDDDTDEEYLDRESDNLKLGHESSSEDDDTDEEYFDQTDKKD